MMNWRGYNIPWVGDVISGTGVAPFGPASISNCVLWLDPTDSASMSQSGGFVGQWNDKSGSGNGCNVVQSNATYKPSIQATGINGNQSLQFSATSTSAANTGMGGTLAIGALTSFSLFVVIKLTAASQFDSIFCGGHGATGGCTFEVGGGASQIDLWVSGVGAAASTGASTISIGTIYVVGVTYDGTSVLTYINNVQKGNTSPSVSRQIDAAIAVGGDSTLAGFNNLRGHVGHVCLYSGVISSTDRNNLYNNYLKTYAGT